LRVADARSAAGVAQEFSRSGMRTGRIGSQLTTSQAGRGHRGVSAWGVPARPNPRLLRAESASPLPPGPIRQRLAGRAIALEKIAERHARTRIAPGDDDARR
jgi:hypothetical protein